MDIQGRRDALATALGVNEMEPCVVYTVRNVPNHLVPRMGHRHEKGAVVELDWWLKDRQTYERRQIVVSRERGDQFRRSIEPRW